MKIEGKLPSSASSPELAKLAVMLSLPFFRRSHMKVEPADGQCFGLFAWHRRLHPHGRLARDYQPPAPGQGGNKAHANKLSRQKSGENCSPSAPSPSTRFRGSPPHRPRCGSQNRLVGYCAGNHEVLQPFSGVFLLQALEEAQFRGLLTPGRAALTAPSCGRLACAIFLPRFALEGLHFSKSLCGRGAPASSRAGHYAVASRRGGRACAIFFRASRGRKWRTREVRTSDPQIRSLVLYPAELRVRFGGANLFRSPAKGKDNWAHPQTASGRTPISRQVSVETARIPQSGIVLPCPPPPLWLRLGPGSARACGMGLGFGAGSLRRAGRRASEKHNEGNSSETGAQKGLVLSLAMGAGLSLAACSDIDSMFGADDTYMAEAPTASDAGAAPPPPVASAAVPGAAPVATITPVTIDAGPDTGTAVNKTVQSLRAQVSGLQQKLAANAARFADLRNSSAGAASSLSGIQGPHHHPPADRHHPRQPRTGGGMEFRPGPVGRAVGQHQCHERAGHRRDQRLVHRPLRAGPDQRDL